ncbi:uncharacterized protein LOC119379401 [Rhipicephalus sanguineus]|uniref:uncharacterized protein LOC119379401 n=1 Tax=Rhipicephalus sanguineus TaxID=34632 RepID=UPI0020C2EE26|nr:uncharacterized protein LOC119379401 [Rhipicephalus sanguineus]
MTWTTTPVRYLGVPLEHYRDTTQYWNDETKRVKEQTDKWGGRDFSVFTRASVCNVFLVAKVWYVLQALCMSRVNVQKLHRVFAVFVWRSTWERTSRTNLFRSLRSGGLGLVHLFLKQIVSRFIFLRDQKNGFLRTAIQTRLANAIPEFVVSSIVKQGNVRGFLRQVVLSFQMLRVRFSMEYLSNVPKKRLYKDIIDVMLPVPVYRAMYCVGSERNVLKRVKRMIVRPSVKTFFFQLHTNTLTVKPWLKDKGMFVPWSIKCLICRKPETIEHILLDCWDAVFLWDVLKRTLKKELPVTPYGIRFLPVENENGVPYDMIMALTLHSLWKTCMAVRNVDVDAKDPREYFIESIVQIRDVYKSQSQPPDWLPVLDTLVTLKRF